MTENQFEFLELDTEKKMPRMVNIGAIFAIVLAALLSMGEVAFSWNGLRDLSLLVAVIYVVATLIYKNNYAGGILRGKASDEYKEAKREYDEVKAKITSTDVLPKLPELCVEFCLEELKQYRATILAGACITYDDYEENYINKGYKELKKLGLTGRAIKCVTKADRAKAKHFDPQSLLSEEGSRLIFRRSILGVSSKMRERIDFGTNAFTRAATAVLSGMIAVNILWDFSFAMIATWGVRMLPILGAAISSTAAGVNNVMYTLIPNIRRKTEIMRAILAKHNMLCT